MFDAGARHAQVEQARAAFDQDVADLPPDRADRVPAGRGPARGACASWPQQAEAQDAAVASAREAERIINNQYQAGTVAYTSVVVAQTDGARRRRRPRVNIRQSRLVASVALIQALGGGWDAAQLPSRERIDERRAAQLQPVAADPAGAGPLKAAKLLARSLCYATMRLP